MHVLMSLSINKIDPSMRNKFYKELEDKKFVKVDHVETVWTRGITHDSSVSDTDRAEQGEKQAAKDIKAAAKAVDLNDYEAIVGVCYSKSTEFQVNP
ncbi:MAG: hypothetical protein DRG78_01490 [Epsilonproteobacteria bacterium]|nr:MAG: hypothetical protein DRG78_01490 [Campylobacterota bacterium]